MSIYETSVKKPITTALIYVAIAILGLFALTRLAIELMPNTDTTTVMIITAYPGASAEDIESNVTKVLENSLNGIDKLKHISSKSQENSSIITMQFRAGTPIAEATNDIRDKLDATSELLPTGAKKPTIFKFDNASIPVAMLSVQSKESAPALAKILEDKVTNPLQRIDGVGSVSVLGATKRVIQVYCDPSKLEAYHLTTQQIAQIIGAENTNIPAGQIDLGSRTNSLRVQGEFTDPAQLSSIIVASVGGKDVHLSDVATVKDTVAERQQENYINGMTGAMVMISKQTGSNSVKISEQVRRMLPQIQQSLPSDVKLDYLIDTSSFIVNTINSLQETIYITFVIVMLVVFIFLGRWRATFIIVLTIPISLVASFIYLLVSGNSLNVISLSSLSIAIGMVVDDAIVVLENVTTHIERGSAPKQAAIHGTNEVGISVIASTLTMLAVFLPLTMTPGDAGIMFRQLGWSISIVMIVSTAAALSLTPMLSSQLLRKGVSRGKVLTRFFAPIESFLGKLDLLYARLLGWTVRHRRSTILSALGIFVLSLLGLQFIKSSFMPKQDVGFIDASVELPVGTRVEETRQFALDLEARMRQTFPAIQTISMSVGQADASNTYASTQENGSNVASMFIGLRPQKERSMTQDEVAAGLRSLFAKTPEVTSFKVSSGDGNPNSSSGLVIELYGQDFQRSDSYARLLSEQLKEKASVSGITISRKDYTPELRFVFDRTKLAEQGLNLATASSYLRSAVNGTVSSYFREEGSEYDIRVSLAPEARQSVQDLMSILVYTPQGKAVRLSELGRLDESFTPPTIERKDRSRYVSLTVNAAPGSQLSEVVADARQILDAHPLPEGMSYKLTGAYESQQETFGDLGVLMALIVLLVFIVMAAQFESLVDPFVIMFSVPFAFTGVFIGLLVTQVPMDTMTFIGMIMLIGIVVKNGIVLIDYIRLCRERGMIISRAVVTSGKSRLRPVLMTTMTTVLGMLPMALGIGEGSEMWQAMGITVAWGLSISTLVTLVLIPTLYAALEARRLKRRRI
nr:efflux RND transporter permease subunit [uncultured Porphyromonas sp.]